MLLNAATGNILKTGNRTTGIWIVEKLTEERGVEIMVRRATLTATQSAKAVKKGMRIFTALAAALFLVSFASAVMATESMQGNADILFGKITAVDTSHPTNSLTLQSGESGAETMNIFVNDETAVKMCDAEKSLKDIKVGSNVQVTYYELAGVAVADFVYVPC
jgi:hypothetical protein